MFFTTLVECAYWRVCIRLQVVVMRHSNFSKVTNCIFKTSLRQRRYAQQQPLRESKLTRLISFDIQWWIETNYMLEIKRDVYISTMFPETYTTKDLLSQYLKILQKLTQWSTLSCKFELKWYISWDSVGLCKSFEVARNMDFIWRKVSYVLCWVAELQRPQRKRARDAELSFEGGSALKKLSHSTPGGVWLSSREASSVSRELSKVMS